MGSIPSFACAWGAQGGYRLRGSARKSALELEAVGKHVSAGDPIRAASVGARTRHGLRGRCASGAHHGGEQSCRHHVHVAVHTCTSGTLQAHCQYCQYTWQAHWQAVLRAARATSIAIEFELQLPAAGSAPAEQPELAAPDWWARARRARAAVVLWLQSAHVVLSRVITQALYARGFSGMPAPGPGQ